MHPTLMYNMRCFLNKYANYSIKKDARYNYYNTEHDSFQKYSTNQNTCTLSQLAKVAARIKFMLKRTYEKEAAI